MTTWGDARMPERFWDKVQPEPNSGCWLWTASETGPGYAQFSVEARPRLAHRVAYEALVGPIPAGHDLDHLCRTRCCVNPAHLEPVTRSENLRRSPIMGRANLAKTHCPHGHPYDERNTYIYAGGRHCRSCMKRRDQESRARSRS